MVSFPARVQVTDITGRDGLQNVAEWIPTLTKIRLLDALAASGIRKMEATSFVSPKAIPQMADAADIVAHMREQHPQIDLVVLAPNLRGAENAARAGVPEISYVISASEAHNRANIRRSHEESLADLAAIRAAFPSMRVNLSLSTVFGCPFAGEVPVDAVMTMVERALAQGAVSVSLCDTIGVANPRQVRELLRVFRSAWPHLTAALHLHDTHGLGLANTYAALEEGIDRFETAAGGLGGCPFAPGAAGNTSTEDMVNMLHRMGIDTGIDLGKLLDAVALIRESVPAPLPGRLASARSYAEFTFYRPQGGDTQPSGVTQ